MEAYLQHGAGTSGPFRTESVPVKIEELPWQKAGLTWTATGYGQKIPTRYMVQFNGRWRRVYAFQISNAGTLFIGKNLRSGIVVNICN